MSFYKPYKVIAPEIITSRLKRYQEAFDSLSEHDKIVLKRIMDRIQIKNLGEQGKLELLGRIAEFMVCGNVHRLSKYNRKEEEVALRELRGDN